MSSLSHLYRLSRCKAKGERLWYCVSGGFHASFTQAMISSAHNELFNGVYDYFTSWFSFENRGVIIFINALLFISIDYLFIPG